ncbi:hypothetical protein SDC9_141501 [bioreactor metagenome]|uniref:Uncharacterized protein n=1 Tax=bioreactor metagenome TaxID=1076179 RepID=A0A645DYG4_9ZZZZ|nr:hypothetical protein [Rikenellaceae bacterium]
MMDNNNSGFVTKLVHIDYFEDKFGSAASSGMGAVTSEPSLGQDII